jgi:putative phosphoesterase
MTLIGLISDVHAQPAPVEEALSIFAREGVSQIFCGGDIAGYNQQLQETIALLEDHSVQSIIGNHDLHYLAEHAAEADSHETDFLRQLPTSISTVIEGRSLYLVHAQPPFSCHGGIKLRDRNGALIPELVEHWTKKFQSFEHDVLIVGHTHQVFAEQMGSTLVINPGSSVFNHSCAILRLPEMTVEQFALSGKAIEPTWNWGEYMIRGKKR